MIARQKKLQARFYETASGRRPVREWLLEMSDQDRRSVGFDVQTVEFGWPVGMPTCRALGDGLWEVRSDLSNGVTARIIFCLIADKMILLHGFVKKTQKTPQKDLALARARMKEILP